MLFVDEWMKKEGFLKMKADGSQDRINIQQYISNF